MGTSNNPMFRGRAGNLVFYTYRGKPCCRSLPGSIKQTTATKKSASQFGLAVRLSRFLRDPFAGFFPDPKDKTLLYSFNKAIMQWMRETKPTADTCSLSNFFIDQFQFNEEAPLPVLVRQPVVTRFSETGDITIDIPELTPGKDIIAPEETVNIHWQARVAGTVLDFERRMCSHVFITTNNKRSDAIKLPYSGQVLPSVNLSLNMKLTQSALTIVVLCLKYEVAKGKKTEMVTDRRWQPVCIVGSCFGTMG